jgi:hypothetical protein
MRFSAIIYSVKQFVTGLIVKSISDDVQTAVTLNRAARIRQIEEQITRDHEAGNTSTAAMLESSLGRLSNGELADDGFAFLNTLVEQAEVPLALTDASDGAADGVQSSAGKRGAGKRGPNCASRTAGSSLKPTSSNQPSTVEDKGTA